MSDEETVETVEEIVLDTADGAALAQDIADAMTEAATMAVDLAAEVGDADVTVEVRDDVGDVLDVEVAVEADSADDTDEADAAEATDDTDQADDAVAAPGGDRATAESELDTESDIVADYLEELLDIVDLDGDIDTYTEGDRPHVSIVTESQVLVGKHGEVLDALQELSRLVVLTETGHRSRLILDIAGHRDKRRKELLNIAQDAMSEVELTGEAVRLPAMNSFERKIIHDAVAEAGLVSESEGVEPQRRVVISAQ